MHRLKCPNHDNLPLCTLTPRHAGAQFEVLNSRSMGAKEAHRLPRFLLDSILLFPINHVFDKVEVYGNAGRSRVAKTATMRCTTEFPVLAHTHVTSSLLRLISVPTPITSISQAAPRVPPSSFRGES